MKWKKIKHLFVADQHSDWMYSHASNAVFTPIDDRIGRVYFSCRDQLGRSHIAFIDLDFANQFKVVAISDQAVLSPGPAGSFDDSGVVMGCFQQVGEKMYLYYLGWNLKVTVPWLNTIGLAVGIAKNGKFEKFSPAPIMDRSKEDPFSISYPSILYENGVYRMWYGSNLGWGKNQEDMRHVIKYASSKDGIQWERSNQIALNLEHENEYALSKPWVIKEQNIYKMWYSYRGNGKISDYRIGYAESTDGFHWRRMDELAGIDVSQKGWDSQMISYPCIFNFRDQRYMLYNGNDYGKTGFGIAQLEKK